MKKLKTYVKQAKFFAEQRKLVGAAKRNYMADLVSKALAKH